MKIIHQLIHHSLFSKRPAPDRSFLEWVFGVHKRFQADTWNSRHWHHHRPGRTTPSFSGRHLLRLWQCVVERVWRRHDGVISIVHLFQFLSVSKSWSNKDWNLKKFFSFRIRKTADGFVLFYFGLCNVLAQSYKDHIHSQCTHKWLLFYS